MIRSKYGGGGTIKTTRTVAVLKDKVCHLNSQGGKKYFLLNECTILSTQKSLVFY